VIQIISILPAIRTVGSKEENFIREVILIMFIFKNRFGEFRSGWSTAAAIILIVSGMMIMSAIVPEGQENDIFIKIIITLVYSLLVIGGGLLLFKLIYKRPLRQMGLIKKGWLPDFLHGLAIGVISIGIVYAVFLLSGQAVITGVDLNRLFSFVIVIEFASVCLFAFSEELIARGYIMTALKTTRNKWVILFTSSIIFSLAHLLNDGVTVLSTLNTFLAGLLFAYMFIKSGKLWLSAGFHISWNFVQGDILGMNVSGNETVSVVITEMRSNGLLAGGSYGPEDGITVTIVLLLGLLYTHFFIKTPSYPVWTIGSNLPLIQEKS
jgi:membrane protease YdiL (CAAX protease family)